MTEGQERPQLRFTIRRISPGEEGAPGHRPSPVSPPPEPHPIREPVRQPPDPKQPIRDSTGGLFRRASSVLAFLGSALGTGLSDEAAVRQTPDGAWWAEVEVAYNRLTPLVWTAGGKPYARLGRHWIEISLSGELSDGRDGYRVKDVTSWPVVDLAYLLAQTNLLPGCYTGSNALDVVVPGSLGRWVLRRAAGLGLKVAIIPSARQPLGNDHQAKSGIMLLQLRSQQGRPIPSAFVHSLTNLPYAIVGEPIEVEERCILVDVRQRLPLSPLIVQGMIPQGETWILGPPETGYWRLWHTGTKVDGTLLLDAPTVSVCDVPPLPSTSLPERIPVRLVRRPSARSRVDAVLLDDAELDWLRPFLMGRPIGEMAFLLPGPGSHLLTAPGGLPGALPFGIPLVRVGPGALYLELGTAFYPSLPDGARQARFRLDEHSAVAVVQDTTYRFETSQMMPAWTLWVGDVPEVKAELSRRSELLLARISAAIRQAEAQQALPHITNGVRPPTEKERVQLLKQAQQAELRGDLVGAAQLLEQAGYPGPAGRLYEQAAARL